uniref:Periaxin n=1 Tax=Latimeria chalumnae TaxID=7897 RepID=H3BEN6_LATCH
LERWSRSQEEMKKLELVEVIVETEAEAGVSGINVAGGGKEGIFVKDVLRDSPAAKALSLQEGDQLLSARVYFDNVKYEDALKILQCAEPYKVSFCLKRTVPGTDVTVSPDLASFDIKGPKAKMPKMSVKSIMPVKKKKKAKVTPGKGELSPVDVEFALPKFSKFRKAKGTYGAGVSLPAKERRKKRLKFPRLRVKDAAATKDVSLEIEPPKGTVKVKTPQGKVEGPEVEAKAKVKTPKFGIPFPKTKKPKVDIKEEAKFKPPKVELDISLPTGKSDVTVSKPELETKGIGAGVKGDIEAPDVHAKEGFKIKMPKIGILTESSDVEVKGSLPAAKGEFELEGPESKLKMPTIKVPKVGISLPKAKGPGGKLRTGMKLPSGPEGKLQMPKIKVPKFGAFLSKGEGEISIPEGSLEGADIKLKMPKVELPKFGGKAKDVEVDVTIEPPKVEGGIKAPESRKAEIEGPDIKVKGPKFKLPTFGISAFKEKGEDLSVPEAEVKGPEGPEAKMKLPSVKMPSFDISLPKVPGVDLHLPKADISLPSFEGEVKTHDVETGSKVSVEGPDAKYKLPKISLPTFGLSAKVDIEGSEAKGPKITLPKVDLSLPKIKPVETDVSPPEIEVSVKKPKPDAKLSQMKVDIKGPEVESEGSESRLSLPSIKMPTFDITMPKVDLDIGLPKKMPKVELPKFGLKKKPAMEGSGAKIQLPSVKLPKFDVSMPKLPDVDIDVALPKGAAEKSLELTDVGIDTKSPEISIEGPDAKGKMPKFSFPKFGISGSKSKKAEMEIKSPDAEVDFESPDTKVKGSKIKMPKFGITFPKSKLEGSVDVSGPSLEGDLKTSKPKVDIEQPTLEVESSEAKFKLPTVKLPKVDISAPKVDMDISLPKIKSDLKVKMPRFTMPKFGSKGKGVDVEIEGGVPKAEAKIALPEIEGDVKGKVKGPSGDADIDISGDKVKGKEDIDVKLPKGKVEVKGPEVDTESLEGKVKTPFIKMPKFAMSTPKGKAPEGEVKFDAEAKGTKVKDVDIKMPKITVPKFGSKEGKLDAGLEAEGEVEGPEGKLKSGKIKMPSIELSLPSGRPEGEVLLPKAEVDVSEADIKGYEGDLKIPKMPVIDISAPKIEIDFGLPKPKGDAALQIEGDKGRIKGPKLKVPKVDISLPKIKTTDADVSLTGGEFSIEGPKAPEVDLDISLTKGKDADVKLPKMEGTGYEIDTGAGGSDFKIKMPKINLSGKGQFEPLAEDAEGKIKKPLFKMPDVELSTPKIKTQAETDVNGIDLDGISIKMPKVTMPSFGFSKDKERILSADVSGPAVETSKLKLPKVALSSGKSGSLDISVNGTGQVNGRSETFQNGSPESRINLGKIKLPKVELSSPYAKGKESDAELSSKLESKQKSAKFRFPKFSLSPKSRGMLEISSEQPTWFKIRMPRIGFKSYEEEHTSEEQILQEEGGNIVIV